jgi:hypothetical protein
MQATIRYAKSGAVHVAYQVFGDGAADLVFVPCFISHLEHWWSEPAHARWLRRLGECARVAGRSSRKCRQYCGLAHDQGSCGWLRHLVRGLRHARAQGRSRRLAALPGCAFSARCRRSGLGAGVLLALDGGPASTAAWPRLACWAGRQCEVAAVLCRPGRRGETCPRCPSPSAGRGYLPSQWLSRGRGFDLRAGGLWVAGWNWRRQRVRADTRAIIHSCVARACGAATCAFTARRGCSRCPPSE